MAKEPRQSEIMVQPESATNAAAVPHLSYVAIFYKYVLVISYKRCQGPRGWCSSEETKAEMLAAWQEREAAGELLRADPGSNRNLKRNLKPAGKRLKRVKFEAVQQFFEEFVSQVEIRIKVRSGWFLQAPEGDGSRGQDIV